MPLEIQFIGLILSFLVLFVVAVWILFPFLLRITAPRLKTRWEITQKIVQSLALLAAGLWAIFSFYVSFKKDAGDRFRHRASADSDLRVEILRKNDEHTAFYCVTYITNLHNETDSIVALTYYGTELYVGRTSGDMLTGVVQPPKLKISHPLVKWRLSAQYYRTSEEFADKARRGRDPSEPPNPPVEFVQNYGLPAKQSLRIETQYIILASEDDWIGVQGYIFLDQEKWGRNIIPIDYVQNIAVALRKTAGVERKPPN